MKLLNQIAAVVAFTAAASFATASPIPAGAELLNDRMVREIAKNTFSIKSPAKKISPDKLDERSAAVKIWLSSVGGDIWYKGYLHKFGFPTRPEEMKVSTLIGLKSPSLGSYYIHSPLISTNNVTIMNCGGVELSPSITQKAFCALGSWDSALAFNDSAALAKFREMAVWFLQNQKADGKWEWGMDVPSRNQKAPWISGLSQSVGISVLLREYQLGNDPAYLEAAKKALVWLQKPLNEGGLSMKMRKGVWYEEYPDASNPSHVLNGHMWALFGIWDMYRVTGDKNVKKMFDDGAVALNAEIEKYDVGHWSVYAQTNRVDVVNGAYQQFIIEQLHVMHAITNNKKFEEIANKWSTSMANDTMFIQDAAKEFIKANPGA